MKPLIVVITVPHAICFKNDKKFMKKHLCDNVAKEMAQKLEKKLVGVCKCKIFISNLPRNVCDFNRNYKKNGENIRKSVFRKNITKYLKKNREKYRIFLLDIHSFPGINTPKTNLLEFYVLDNYWAFNPLKKYIKPKFSYLVNHFINHFKSLNFDAFSASTKNDITSEANELGLENFLIEFNERIPKKKI